MSSQKKAKVSENITMALEQLECGNDDGATIYCYKGIFEERDSAAWFMLAAINCKRDNYKTTGYCLKQIYKNNDEDKLIQWCEMLLPYIYMYDDESDEMDFADFIEGFAGEI